NSSSSKTLHNHGESTSPQAEVKEVPKIKTTTLIPPSLRPRKMPALKQRPRTLLVPRKVEPSNNNTDANDIGGSSSSSTATTEKKEKLSNDDFRAMFLKSKPKESAT